MKIKSDKIVEWVGFGTAVLGLSIAIYGAVNSYRSSREFKKSHAELEASIEKLRNPIGEKCDYVSDLPTERELADSLKISGKDGSLDGISLRSWKDVVEPAIAQYSGDDFIHQQNRELAYARFQASSRDVLICCDSFARASEKLGESLGEAIEGLSRLQEHLQDVGEGFSAGISKIKQEANDFHFDTENMRKLVNALDAWLKYDLMPKHDRLEAYLRDRASQSEQDALSFEVFELASPLSSGYYSPKKFYRELTRLLDSASKIEHHDEKQKAVKRLVNIGLGYSRHYLPPREFQIPLLFEFSELGYTPEELREMVMLK